MTLTADRQWTKKGQGRHGYRPVDGGSVIYYGALIALNAAGFVVPADDAAGLVVIGVAEQTVDNSDGSDGDVSVKYVTGVEVEFTNAGGTIEQADMYAFAEDDDAVTDYGGSTNKNFVGPVTSFTSTKAWVFVDEAIIMAHYASNQYSDANDST